MERNSGIDAVRGLAIVTMAFANQAPYLLAGAPPLLFRVVSATAAPLFLVLAGRMLAEKAAAPASYFLRRALYLLLTAGLVDVLVNHLLPYRSFDVLYSLGVATLVLAAVRRWPSAARWGLLVLVVAVTPLLRRWVGYSPTTLDRELGGALLAPPSADASLWRHWLLDGWFPVFPWLAFVLFGYQLAPWLVAERRARVLGAALVLLAAGTCFWALFPGPAYVRLGYIEPFYPPVTGFVLAAAGWAMAVLAALTLRSWERPPTLALFGESALALYVLHLALIKYVLGPVFGARLPAGYVAIYALLLLLMTAAALGMRKLKRKSFPRPSYVRFLLGG